VTAVAAGALPDGTPVIMSGSWDGTVRVWRAAGGAPVGEPLRGHRDRVYAVAAGALPDGTPVIVSGGQDGTIRVWRAAGGAPVGEPLRGYDSPVTAVAVGALPDGTPVIISGGGDGTVRVWRLADRPWQTLWSHVRRTVGYRILTGHTDGVEAVAVGALPDGTPVIISGGEDGTVRVWRLVGGTPVVPPLDLPESIQALAVHGNVIITAAGADIAVHQPALSRPMR
jgi:WD40 repeat protein